METAPLVDQTHPIRVAVERDACVATITEHEFFEILNVLLPSLDRECGWDTSHLRRSEVRERRSLFAAGSRVRLSRQPRLPGPLRLARPG